MIYFWIVISFIMLGTAFYFHITDQWKKDDYIQSLEKRIEELEIMGYR